MFFKLNDVFLPGLEAAHPPEVTTTRDPILSSNWTWPNDVTPDTSTSDSTSSSSGNISGLLTVRWTGKCEGTLHLVPYPPSSSSFLSVCHCPHFNIQLMLKDVCQDKKGCEGPLSWKNTGRNKMECYNITEKGAVKMLVSETVLISCKGWCLWSFTQK